MTIEVNPAVDGDVRIEKGKEDGKDDDSQEGHLEPEIFLPDEALFIRKIDDEESDEKQRINTIVSTAKCLQNIEKANASQVDERRPVEKAKKKKEANRNPGRKEKFEMAEVGHAVRAKSEDKPGDESGRRAAAQMTHQEVHGQRRQDEGEKE